MWAALMNNPEMAGLLIEKGADAKAAYERLKSQRKFPDARRVISGLSKR